MAFRAVAFCAVAFRAVAGLQFLAEAPDQEQAVVDREPESQADHQVQREDRQGECGVDQPQDDERAQHGHPADRHGQQCRDAPEDEEREDRQQREGDGLGEAQVGLRLLAGLRPGGPADPWRLRIRGPVAGRRPVTACPGR